MRFFLFLFTFLSFASHAQVSIEIIPRNPSVNEVFQILFKCNVEGREDPEINFNARNFEVLDKQSQGLSTRTIYQAGKITVSKELLISYTAVAKKTGMATVANTRVRMGTKIINKDDVSFQVLERPAGPKLVFIAAEVSKDDVYVNEGITLRYYLYRKVGIQSTDIKKYPKLDMFMKRYLQENENPQRVTVNGELLVRSTLYSARLYPEEPGEFTVDPMELTVSYSKENLGAFGFGFGMSGRDLVTTNIASEPIKIKVKALPELNKPKDFSGLVGTHKFDFVIGRPNILVNEPLEARLSINGPGKLEGLTPVSLFTSKSLEQFDVKADLALVGAEAAVKTFTYTFLGKSNDLIPPSLIKISYFNVDTKSYETWTQEIPEIRIAGAESQPPSNVIKPTEKKDTPPAGEASSVVLVEKNKFDYVVIILILFAVAGLGIFSVYRGFDWRFEVRDEKLSSAIKSLKSGTYGHKELAILFEVEKGTARAGIKESIDQSNINTDLKEYFNGILGTLDLNVKNGSDNKLPRVTSKALKGVLQHRRDPHDPT